MRNFPFFGAYMQTTFEYAAIFLTHMMLTFKIPHIRGNTNIKKIAFFLPNEIKIRFLRK